MGRDAVGYTPGSGENVVVDKVDGAGPGGSGIGDVQVVKLDSGTEGGINRVEGGPHNTLPVYPRRKQAGFFTNLSSVTTAAYSSGQQIGDVNQIGGLDNTYQPSAVLHQLAVIDRLSVHPVFDIVFFSAYPSSLGGDHTTFAPAANQVGLITGIFSVLAADYVSVGANGSVATYRNVEMWVSANVADSPYVAYVARGAITFSDVSVPPFILGGRFEDVAATF